MLEDYGLDTRKKNSLLMHFSAGPKKKIPRHRIDASACSSSSQTSCSKLRAPSFVLQASCSRLRAPGFVLQASCFWLCVLGFVLISQLPIGYTWQSGSLLLDLHCLTPWQYPIKRRTHWTEDKEYAAFYHCVCPTFLFPHFLEKRYADIDKFVENE